MATYITFSLKDWVALIWILRGCSYQEHIFAIHVIEGCTFVIVQFEFSLARSEAADGHGGAIGQTNDVISGKKSGATNTPNTLRCPIRFVPGHKCRSSLDIDIGSGIVTTSERCLRFHLSDDNSRSIWQVRSGVPAIIADGSGPCRPNQPSTGIVASQEDITISS